MFFLSYRIYNLKNEKNECDWIMWLHNIQMNMKLSVCVPRMPLQRWWWCAVASCATSAARPAKTSAPCLSISPTSSITAACCWVSHLPFVIIHTFLYVCYISATLSAKTSVPCLIILIQWSDSKVFACKQDYKSFFFSWSNLHTEIYC